MVDLVRLVDECRKCVSLERSPLGGGLCVRCGFRDVVRPVGSKEHQPKPATVERDVTGIPMFDP